MTRTAGVVLAAGRATRFGRQKIVEPLGSRSLLAHVLGAATAAGLDPVIVVVPPEPDIAWAVGNSAASSSTRVVVNERPEDGLSSSVRLGFAALSDAPVDVDAAVVLLGDQPLVRPEVVRRLMASDDQRPFVVATYANGANPNPVLVRREGWWVADELRGDRGFGAWMADHPRLVATIDVAGTNPDVDTPADLARLEARFEEPPDASPIRPARPILTSKPS